MNASTQLLPHSPKRSRIVAPEHVHDRSLRTLLETGIRGGWWERGNTKHKDTILRLLTLPGYDRPCGRRPSRRRLAAEPRWHAAVARTARHWCSAAVHPRWPGRVRWTRNPSPSCKWSRIVDPGRLDPGSADAVAPARRCCSPSSRSSHYDRPDSWLPSGAPPTRNPPSCTLAAHSRRPLLLRAVLGMNPRLSYRCAHNSVSRTSLKPKHQWTICSTIDTGIFVGKCPNIYYNSLHLRVNNVNYVVNYVNK